MINKEVLKIFEKNKYRFIHKKTTTSTMSDVKDYLNENEKDCVIVSDIQTRGRGRRGSLWYSPYGNLHCSLSFSNHLKVENHFVYSLLICISIKSSLEKLNVNKIKFKWPNDIFYENKKFCGMISQFFQSNKFNSYIVFGFGINIESSPNLKRYLTTYLKEFCNVKNISHFLNIFFEVLFKNLCELKINNALKFKSIYEESLMFIGEKIEIMTESSTILKGKCMGINNDGSLILEYNGVSKNIYNGSIIV
jgi:BirA family biotin operon repressor/biotin-[acetyl-CoA-carboxylase] ligase